MMLAAAVIGASVASDLLQHRKTLEVVRYTLPAAPAIYAIIASIGESLPLRRSLAAVLPAVVFVSCVLAIPEAYNQYWKPDYRGAAADFDRAAGSDDMIIASYLSRRDWYDSLLMSALTHYSSRPQRPALVLSGPMSDSVRAEVSRRAGAVWFITGNPDCSDRLQLVLPGAVITRTLAVPMVGVFVKVELSGMKGVE
jgi:hypothetical protein